MAHLLLMYQYLRAKREVNELTAKSFKFSSKKNRIKDNIEKTQKYYTDAKAKIAAQAKRMTSAGSVFFQNSVGLGAGMMSNFINPYNQMSGGNAFVMNWLNQNVGSEGLNSYLAQAKLEGLDSATAGEMYNLYMTGAIKADAKETGHESDPTTYNNGAYTEAQYKAFMATIQCAQQAQYQAQTWVQNANANFQQNISIWEEAMNAQLEAEQDAALEPLNYEETMMELEETSTKTKLEEKKQELDNIKQELSQRVKEDAVSFGLS